MKRLISSVLVMVMVLTMVPITSHAGPGPTVTWYDDGALTARWEMNDTDKYDFVYDIQILYCETESGEYEQIEYQKEWTCDCIYTVSPRLIALYGDGYYEIHVQPIAHGSGYVYGWKVSDAYHYAPSSFDANMPAPTNLVFDEETGEISFDAPVGSNGESYESHYFITELYYLGEDGTSEPELFKRLCNTGTSAWISNFDMNDNAQDGYYTLAVSTFANNYITEGESEKLWLDTSFYYEDTRPVLDAPSGLAWDGRYASWDTLDLGSDACYRLEFMHSDTEIENPVANWEVSISSEIQLEEKLTSGEDVEEYVRSFSDNALRQLGDGWYYFRVQAYNCNGDYKDSEWSYSVGTYIVQPQLNTPTDVFLDTSTGQISFRTVENGEFYCVEYYRIDETGKQELINTFLLHSSNVDVLNISEYMTKSGTYYFTVYAYCVDSIYKNSDLATSNNFVFMLPDVQLNVTEAAWDRNFMTWTAVEEEVYVDYYEIRLYAAGDETITDKSEMKHINNYTVYPGEDLPNMAEDALDYGKDYYYWFDVRAVTADFTKAVTGEWSALVGPQQYVVPKMKVPQANDLQWDVRHWAGEEEAVYGCISFQGQVGYDYLLEVWRVNEAGEDELVYNEDYSAYSGNDYYVSVLPFKWGETEQEVLSTTGTYYYTVTTYGDGITTGDSEPVRSENWEYVRPETTLIATDLQWSDEYILSWTCENEEYVERYRVTFYFSETEDGAYHETYKTTYYLNHEPFVPEDSVFSRGEGYYYFDVYAQSNNVRKAASGRSEVYGPVKHIPPADPAPVPTEVQLHVYRDEETGESTPSLGYASFKGEVGTTYRYMTYFKEENGPERGHGSWVTLDTPWFNWSTSAKGLGEGWYKVGVYAEGNNFSTYDSEEVFSESWHYTKPETVLKLTDPKWDTTEGLPMPIWTEGFEDPSLVKQYTVRFYFSETEDGVYEECWGGAYTPEEIAEKVYPVVDEEMFLEYGEGWYKFTVEAYTADFTKALDGEMTELSDAYHFVEPETKEEPPTELQWHVYYNTKSGEESYSPGAISFKGEVDKTYRMELYYSKDGQEYELYSSRNRNMTSEQYSWTALSDDVETGWYKFCVYTQGDMINTGNSEVVWSELWQYVEPDLVLELSEPKWDVSGERPAMTWKCGFDDLSLLDRYRVLFYFSETEDGKLARVGSTYIYPEKIEEAEKIGIPTDILLENGSGYYKFTVQAYTVDFTKAQTGEMTGYSDVWHYVEPETKAPAPTDLTWHVYRDEETGETAPAPGVMSFQGTVGTEYCIELHYSSNGTKYKEYDSDAVLLEEPWYNADWYVGDFEEGWYKFCVYALGDAINATNSEPVWSEVWQFTPPDLVLELSEPKWDVAGELPAMTWKCGFDDLSLAEEYYVTFYFSETEDGTFTKVSGEYIDAEEFEENGKIEIPTDILGENKSGWYKFTVRAYTADFTKAQNGKATEQSEAYYYAVPEAKMEPPSGLAWHVSRYSGGEREYPGMMSFLGEEGVEYTIELHYSSDGQTYRRRRSSTYSLSSSWRNWNIIQNIANYGGGWYKFCVYAHGDMIHTANSDVVWSDVWQFVAPDQVLELSEPTWVLTDGFPVMNWELGFEDLSLVEGFDVGLYYAETENGLYEEIDSCYYDPEEFQNGETTIPAAILSEYGNGYYKFTVQADTADFTKAQNGAATGFSEAYYFAEPETKAAAPSELQWHIWRDPETGASKEDPALISFRGEVGSTYNLKLYYSKDGENYDLDTERRVTLGNCWYNRNIFTINEQPEEGWYQFCVYTQGDMIHTANSDVIWSDPWQYIAPDLTLEVTDPKWDTSKEIPTMTWTNLFEGTEYVNCYDIEVSWSKTQNGAYEPEWGYTVYPEEIGADGTVVIDSDVLAELGAGWYKFKVMVCSDDITKAQTGTYSELSDAIYFGGPKEKLEEPTELLWHKEYRWNEKTEEWELVDRMGSIAVKPGASHQSMFEMELYRVTETGDKRVLSYNWNYTDRDMPEYLHRANLPYGVYDQALQEDGPLVSGTYYFRVRAKGDLVTYSHSEWVESETWTYEAPTAALDTVSDLQWNDINPFGDLTMEWAVEKNTAVGYYEFQVYYAETEEDEKRAVYRNYDLAANSPNGSVPAEYVMDYGEGYYFFKVRAIPADMTEYLCSEWSELSESYFFTFTAEDVQDRLDSITNVADDLTVEEIKEAVGNMDKRYLADAMAADTGDNGVVEQIQQLEAQTGIKTNVSKAEGADMDIDTSKVSVVGAALNAEENVDVVTLVIGKAEETFVLEDQYDNTVAFSLHLNVTGDEEAEVSSQQLTVPVKISLPIPENIHPEVLLIYHRLANGAVEEITPYIYNEDGQWFASFVVTSFSDFAMAWNDDGNPVSEVTVAETENGILVEVALEETEAEALLCAVYDQNDQMLGVTELNGSGIVVISCNARKAYKVRIFLIDGTNAPICRASETRIR